VTGVAHSRSLNYAAAGIVLAAAFIVVLRSRTAQPDATPLSAPLAAVSPATPADIRSAPPSLAASPAEAARLRAALGEAMNSVSEAERVVDEAVASLDFTSLLKPANLGSAAGRQSLLGMLERAEEIANLRRQVTEQNLERVRLAAAAAPVAPGTSQEFLRTFEVRALTTSRAAEKLHDMEMQTISTARHMIAFMEQNPSNYRLHDEAVTFNSQGMQVQYMHYVTQVGQLLQRETRARGLDVAARQEQARLVEALEGG
jgi:hypothetical protein